MAQKRLDEFSDEASASSVNRKKGEMTISTPDHGFSVVAPENIHLSYLVSAGYDGQTRKARVKLYEPVSGRMYSWLDNTGHKPYCLTNLSPYELEKISRVTQHQGFDHFEIVNKFDPLLNKNVKVTKIVAKDPLAIGGRSAGCIRDIIPEDFPKISDVPITREEIKVWESSIKYYQSYIFDRGLLPGMIYEVRSGNLIPKKLEKAERTIRQICAMFKNATAEELGFIEQWARLLEYPAPKFRLLAIDIEVLSPIPTRVPDPREAAYDVVCVSLYGSNGLKRVLLLKREGIQEGAEDLPADSKVQYYDTEKELLRAVFEALWKHPFVLTFNGDDFDLRYLQNRALYHLGFKRNEIPIEVRRRSCFLKYGVHIDLYRFFFNRSIKIYAFSNRYRDVRLNDVGKALIGTEKIPLENSLGELTYTELPFNS